MLQLARQDCEKEHPVRLPLNIRVALSLQILAVEYLHHIIHHNLYTHHITHHKTDDCRMAPKQHNKLIKDLKPTLSLHVYGLLEGAWPLTKRLIIVLNFLGIGSLNGRLSPSRSK